MHYLKETIELGKLINYSVNLFIQKSIRGMLSIYKQIKLFGWGDR